MLSIHANFFCSSKLHSDINIWIFSVAYLNNRQSRSEGIVIFSYLINFNSQIFPDLRRNHFSIKPHRHFLGLLFLNFWKNELGGLKKTCWSRILDADSINIRKTKWRSSNSEPPPHDACQICNRPLQNLVTSKHVLHNCLQKINCLIFTTCAAKKGLKDEHPLLLSTLRTYLSIIDGLWSCASRRICASGLKNTG